MNGTQKYVTLEFEIYIIFSFLKLLLSGKSVCVSQAIKSHSREMKPE